MKKVKIYNKYYFLSLLLMSMSFSLVSCDNEFNEPSNISGGNTNPPVITSVNEAREDVSVTEGVLENLYYIKGQNLGAVTSIQYNGFEAGFNPVYVTENLIISKIPEDAPYISEINKLRVETLYGVAEYNFSLLAIEGFSEEVIDGKSVLIFSGGDFTNVESASFVSGTEELGNLVERPANVLSASQTEVIVEVPDGVIQAFIYLITSSGASIRSTSYGFNYPIFTDELIGWTLSGWDGEQGLSSEVALGSTSIKRSSLNYGGLSLFPGDDNETLVLADYSTFLIQIYPATASTKRVNFALNDFTSPQYLINLIPGQWNKIEIPISSIYPAGTAPETITRIDFQMFAEDGDDPPYLYYVDQFGLLE